MSAQLDPATTAEQREAELRHAGVRLALRMLVAGHGEATALNVINASVAEQARVLGIREAVQ